MACFALPELLAHDSERLTRFEREAKLLATLNHPNIATINGLEEADGKRLLILEPVKGALPSAKLTDRESRLEVLPIQSGPFIGGKLAAC